VDFKCSSQAIRTGFYFSISKLKPFSYASENSYYKIQLQIAA
jgi:hypothetical protein